MNKHIINLKIYKKLLYKLIYSLRLIELKTLKTYIKIKLINNFFYSFKYSTNIFILFA